MTSLPTDTPPQEPALIIADELVRAYHAFATFNAHYLQQYDLTPPQADVIFILGQAHNLTFKELGQKTAITKGTLTGVINRLEKKGWLRRIAHIEDRRSTKVALTVKGEQRFLNIFPARITYLKTRFARLSKDELHQVEGALKKLRHLF